MGWSEVGLGVVCFLQLKGKEESSKGNRVYMLIGVKTKIECYNKHTRNTITF